MYDALAIAIALFSDELDVRLISTVAGNVGLDKVTYNALRLLKYLGVRMFRWLWVPTDR